MEAIAYVPEQQDEAHFKKKWRKTNALEAIFSDQRRLARLRIGKRHCRTGDANLGIIQISGLSLIFQWCLYSTYAAPANLSTQP